MLSKNKIKFIRSLELKKFRKENGVFLAEGNKLVSDLAPHFKCKILVTTEEWLSSNKNIKADETIIAEKEELSRASLLKSPQDVLAVFETPSYPSSEDCPQKELCLALDDVQDPGNLGTIIRIADWFGINNIYCSHGTADAFSPKTVQATMGALARVKIHYCDIKELISKLNDTPVFGTFLDGDNIYESTLSSNGLIVMGNEGNGISKEVASLINRRILIPNYPQGNETTDSLNVAVATAIVCSEFRRRQL
ncbi:TrmH family RNA methyltransferase [Bacteroides caecigallinarum]|uniref:TrmH family RNA methyltransferase n=1 Tax=Bacteroides caecigallinarum TaxID=1411144 RepID=UPI001F3936B0|nr:RNA methyltransferase [Bacteroides caecigallinarum]MCF2582748.1 RNA methyltransferase [Bacteroides caecigallinarum]